jgi:hypothetical protein
MQFPLSRISVLILLIFACGTNAWAQSKSAKFADLTIGDFNATIFRRVFPGADKTHYKTPIHLTKPVPNTHLYLTIRDFNATISKRVFPAIVETHYKTPRHFKEPAPNMHLDLSETAQEIRLNFAPEALNSGAPLLTTPLLRDTARNATPLMQTNQSPRNDQENVFPNKPKLYPKLAPQRNGIEDLTE